MSIEILSSLSSTCFCSNTLVFDTCSSSSPVGIETMSSGILSSADADSTKSDETRFSDNICLSCSTLTSSTVDKV
jgi:hypothetical protein